MTRTASIAALALVLAGPLETDRHARVAEKLASAINADDQEAIQALFAPPMQDALPAEKAGPFFRGILREHGKIAKVGAPRGEGAAGRMPLIFERGKLDLRLVLDDADRITGLEVVPPEKDGPVPERSSVPMRLPFEGEWLVFWGGATEEENYHVKTRSQRRALDLVIADEKGKSHRGDGKRNEDYYGYSKEILAPADGTVVTVIDGVPENEPGSMNPFSAVGNCVILRHAEREHSVLAHLQPGSIKVKAGQKVKRGQVLGRCGNSGNSSEPHLHFHLQDAAVLQDGTGFAPFFQAVQVTRDGKTGLKVEHSPRRGERVRAVR
ncbi:MAG: peptidoglycan DD-metalloendopeptidase family protein [Planctomycetes bacterium]|nr:peptidoglycan DD-metalloendopeptidase family protein [Planctomycetota bacterium]